MVDFKRGLRKAFGDDIFLSLKFKNETDDSFEFVIDKYSPLESRGGLDRGSGHIKGTYTNYVDYKKIKIHVRPNIIWFLLLLLLLGLILYNLYLLIAYKTDTATTLFKITAFLFAIVIDYIMAKLFSDNIKDNFEDFILTTRHQ